MCMTLRLFIKQQVELYLRVFYMLQQDDDLLLLSKEDAIVKALHDLNLRNGKSVFQKNMLPYFPNGLTEGMLSTYISLRFMARCPVVASIAFILHQLNDKIEPTKGDLFEGKMQALVYEDASPFLRNPKELDIWSNDYFVQLAGMVRIG